MKIAFVYDKVNKFGGAERVLTSLHEIWPEAPLYTAVYNKATSKWADTFKITASYLKYFPFSATFHEFFPLMTPGAFEMFDLDAYDIVLSITSADAKGIITKPGTLHVCYCLTPTRYLWSGYQNYLKEPGMGFFNPIARFFLKVFAPRLRKWDYISSTRPDLFIAISQTVRNRIKTYYRRESDIIYPPVDTDLFTPSKTKGKSEYYLIVSRLVPYKRIDYCIKAFNETGQKLKIIGTGIDTQRLKKMARDNIEFLGGDLTDEKLCWYYQNCRAYIYPGEEDFGITAAEAQSCGKPVIGLKTGGVGEIVTSGITGEVYDKPEKALLISALKKSEKKEYSAVLCRKNAFKFSKQKFQKKIKEYIENCFKERKSII